MCGIIASIGQQTKKDKKRFIKLAEKIKHRGDKPFEYILTSEILAGTQRLSIIDRENSQQPIFNEDRTKLIIFNGEIYNYKKIKRQLEKKHIFKTNSDTETILHGFEEWGPEIVKKLDGQFAFLIYDFSTKTTFVARDPFGIKPLFHTTFKNNQWFASEVKALPKTTVHEIKPGTFWMAGKETKYFHLPEKVTHHNKRKIKNKIRKLFEEAVRKRVQTDLPVGVFLSGGIDSSLVLYYALKFHNNVKVFTLGEPESEDIKHAKIVTDFLKVKLITIKQKYDDVKKYIKQSETFEPNIISCAPVSAQIARLAQKHGIKVVLVGEGIDELLGGYSEFKKMSPLKIHKNCLRYTKQLYRTQLLRVDRMSMMYGVETRTPFLDEKLAKFLISIDPKLKFRDGNTKWILRFAFEGILPDKIIWREKDPFHRGASKGRPEFSRSEWFKEVPEKELKKIQKKYPEYRLTKNDAYYFKEFIKHYSNLEEHKKRIELPSR